MDEKLITETKRQSVIKMKTPDSTTIKDFISKNAKLPLQYRCGLCGPKSFHNMKELILHMKNEHSFPCNLCSKTFVDRSSLLLHSQTHPASDESGSHKNKNLHKTIEKKFKCDTCGKCFRRKSALKSHMTIHSGVLPYTCGECGAGFRWFTSVVRHRRRVHSQERPFVCELCGDAFRMNSDLSSHKSRHKEGLKTDSGKYKCNICGVVYGYGPYLTDHLRMHSGDKSLKCSVCNAEFDKESRFRWHISKHARESRITSVPSKCKIKKNVNANYKQTTCEYCGKTFSSHAILRLHTRIHTGDKPYKCSVCYERFSLKHRLTEHMRYHTGEKPFVCTSCDARFMFGRELKRHCIVKHNKEKPYKCSECEKTFLNSCGLRRHMVKHSGEIPFRCPFCNRGFKWQKSMTMHILTHTGQKPFKCDVCGKCFRKAQVLKNHCNIHTGIKPFKCTICCKEFRWLKSLSRHKLLHSGERPHKCIFCDKSFTHSHLLSKHILTHTGNVPHKCEICLREFSTWGLLKEHIKLHQPIGESNQTYLDHTYNANIEVIEIPMVESNCREIVIEPQNYTSDTGDNNQEETKLTAKINDQAPALYISQTDILSQISGISQSNIETHIPDISQTNIHKQVSSIIQSNIVTEANDISQFNIQNQVPGISQSIVETCTPGISQANVQTHLLDNSQSSTETQIPENISRPQIHDLSQIIIQTPLPNISQSNSYTCDISKVNLCSQTRNNSQNNLNKQMPHICKKTEQMILPNYLHTQTQNNSHTSPDISQKSFHTIATFASNHIQTGITDCSQSHILIKKTNLSQIDAQIQIADVSQNESQIQQSNLSQIHSLNLSESDAQIQNSNNSLHNSHMSDFSRSVDYTEKIFSINTLQSMKPNILETLAENVSISNSNPHSQATNISQNDLETQSSDISQSCHQISLVKQNTSDAINDIHNITPDPGNVTHVNDKSSLELNVYLPNHIQEKSSGTTDELTHPVKTMIPGSLSRLHDSCPAHSDLEQMGTKVQLLENTINNYDQMQALTKETSHKKSEKIVSVERRHDFTQSMKSCKNLQNLVADFLPSGTKSIHYAQTIPETRKNDVKNALKDTDILDSLNKTSHSFTIVQNPEFELKNCNENNVTVGNQENVTMVNDKKITSKIKHKIPKTKDDIQKGSPCSCSVCGKVCPTKNGLLRHMRLHTGERAYKCHLCPKSYLWEKDFKRHLMVVHEKSKVFKCLICNKEFSDSTGLKSHATVHTDVLAYICDICGKKFKWQNGLKTHLKTHSSMKLHSCPICKKNFTNRKVMKSHMAIHTNEQTYNCHVCGLTFSLENNFPSHFSPHSGTKLYKCSKCDKTDDQSSTRKQTQEQGLYSNNIGQDDTVEKIENVKSQSVPTEIEEILSQALSVVTEVGHYQEVNLEEDTLGKNRSDTYHALEQDNISQSVHFLQHRNDIQISSKLSTSVEPSVNLVTSSEQTIEGSTGITQPTVYSTGDSRLVEHNLEVQHSIEKEGVATQSSNHNIVFEHSLVDQSLVFDQSNADDTVVYYVVYDAVEN